jgi:hypothetical protein
MFKSRREVASTTQYDSGAVLTRKKKIMVLIILFNQPFHALIGIMIIEAC